MTFFDPANPGKSLVAGIILFVLGILLTVAAQKLKKSGKFPEWLICVAFGGLTGFTGFSILIKLAGVI